MRELENMSQGCLFSGLSYMLVSSTSCTCRHPEVKWAEREDKIYLTVLLADAKDPKVNVDPDGTFTFSAAAGTDSNLYELKLELLDKINSEECKINIGVRSIVCVLEKTEKKWWTKLLRGNEKTPHYVKVDWDKWVDEDDDAGAPSDLDLGGMDFSKFGDMGGMGGMGGVDMSALAGMGGMGGMGGFGDDGIGNDFEDSDDEEVKKPEGEAVDKAEAESSKNKAEPLASS
ncbi:hypothetical protein AAHA92_18241 [Salvia divinorum]|uniref:Co-chaperone protein p23 n=1 Tax=Salvia divinorum TaxID=28513 RepID=A0ABD1H2R3_SALDI